MLLPLSLPSPPAEWQVIDIAQWLLDTFGWDVPFLTIRTYALCLMVGMLAAGLIAHARLTRRGGEPGIVLDIGLWAVVFGIIGARTWHVLTHPDDYFGPEHDLLSVFYIWEGGIAIFGALTGGAVGAWIGCRITGIRFWSFADALAPGILVGQAIGRFGNWFNHELFGWPTDLPWGLEIEADNPAFPAGLPDDTLFHPTFLYESIWNLIGVAVILYLAREYRFTRGRVFGVPFVRAVRGRLPLQWGKVFALYLIWYGLGRSWFETIRVDPSEVFLGVRSNVWGAWIAVVLGIVLLIVQTRRHPGREPSVYVPGREWSPQSELESADRYSDDDEGDADDVTSASERPATSETTARP